MNQIDVWVLRVAVISIAILAIIFLAGSPFNDSVTEGITLVLMLPTALALMVFFQNRDNPFTYSIVRYLGWFLFGLWILSKVLRTS